jgi:basic membrane protein A
MKKILALILSLVMIFALVACGTGTPASPSASAAASASAKPSAAASPSASAAASASANASAAPSSAAPRDARTPIPVANLKIGVILVHDENSGYDMSHIEGIKTAIAALGVKDTQVIFKYNIPEDETCYDTAVDLADQGCQMVISDSYGHQSYMMDAAAEYPNVIFLACTGDTAALQPVSNVANMFPDTFQSRYVSGVVAGMKLKQLMDDGKVKDPYVGYVGAYPYAEVVSGYTAFFLGVRSIVPTAHMDVQYTNSWYNPVAEGEAANALMSKGCVIISQHADSTGAPSAVEAANKTGKQVYCVGYNVSMLNVAPTAALTSAQNNWGALYTPIINKMITGEAMPADFSLGYKDNAVMISELGKSCAAGTADKVAAVVAALKDGSLQVFDTKNFTVGGKTITTYAWKDTNGDFKGDSGEAIVNGVFQESVFRSAPYFGLRIDGIKELN